MTRVAKEAYALIGGKFPHPQTMVPGGVSATVNITTMNEIYLRLQQFFDYGKKCAAIYDDICDFFYDVDSRYRDVGRTPANLIDCGVWDEPGRTTTRPTRTATSGARSAGLRRASSWTASW